MKSSQSLFSSCKCLPVVAILICAMGSAGATALSQTSSSRYVGTGTHVNNYASGSDYFYQGFTGALRLTDGSSTFLAYCIDPKTNYNFGANVYTTASLSNFMNAPLAAGSSMTAYQQQFSSYGAGTFSAQSATTVQSRLESLYSHAYASAIGDNTRAAAFGYAVWEIIGESNLSRTGGVLRSSGFDTNSYATTNTTNRDSLERQIDAYLSALSTGSWTNVNGTNLSARTNYVYTVYYNNSVPHTAQNFLHVTQQAVSEPGSLALASLALFAAVGLRRRKQGA